MSTGRVAALLGILTPALFIVSITTGSVALPAHVVWDALTGGDVDPAARAIVDLRFDRSLAALAVGGLLATAGLLLQALLRNPLAEPYVLGTAGGAASFALIALLIALPPAGLPLYAFAGAALATAIVFALGHARRGAPPGEHLLLTGVVVAAGFGALTTLLLTLAPDRRLPGMVFWLLGDLSHATHSWLALAVLMAGVALAWSRANALNLLLRGESVVAALGESPERLRREAWLLASLLTGVAVSVAGPIGFVGLVVPHLLRLAVGVDHRRLLPLSAAGGAAFLLAADTLARTLASPVQLPVGSLTAFLGIPLFLWLAQRSGNR